ncbi:LysR family transcriptional regulator [Brevibacillus humidisoli]|uniref:LysR family transcriptional regulator n=1 Tax=Brevibacillus humidisoli TaxID=2895522 RepID=UPI001E4077B0|nr:LysR family transcriptional regulator [Brevibacillus humidisoli]UFJ41913.1 LysR family transcriptional regulator [Brevibacillus humidisoli]
MDTQLFLTFREVAKWQNFSRAAEALGYAQSSVTAHIQNLENKFQVELFERRGRKIRLTPAGEQLLRYADQVLALLEEAKACLAESAHIPATTTIGTVESLAAFYLPPYVQTFRRQYPETKLLLRPGICSDLRQGVKEGSYDFAIILDELQTHPDLEIIPLQEEELVLIAPPDHRLACAERVLPQDLAGETLIVTESGCSYRTMMENVLRDTDTVLETSLEFGSLEAIKQCVAYGLGIAHLPRIAVQEEVDKGALSVLPFEHPDIRVFRQLVYHKKKWIPRAVHHFFQLLLADADQNGAAAV